ncbi:hypothetical protein MF672_050715 (plasmid) [Actinomadura sp. ATCC 31491]|uniref:Uncharacterized protein n=1 Tax=Actinomadura luzonensis TaxID=2805427 RepID=A0ABT0GD40_9ACTN|nr:hypothetical protein [Actinomadura luzonensis]MCK2215244.1 hypothetical protein [Actinomadura luzonensis]MCK2222028.1 hypothetical protein [Actinomadura luzonensis]
MKEILYGLRCAQCGEVGRLVWDVVRALVECRACGVRACSLMTENEPGEEFGEDFGEDDGGEPYAETEGFGSAYSGEGAA